MTFRMGLALANFLVVFAPTVAFGHDCAAAARGIGTRFFARADLDGDGDVERAETQAAAIARFEQADADRDGVVRRAEAELWARGLRARRLEERFVRLDVDRDNVVALRELGARQRGFARFDLDADGSVTLDELRRASRSEKPLGHGRSRFGRFETWDLDGDGAVRRSEVQQLVSRHFSENDGNRDGVLSGGEVRGRRHAAP